MGRQSKGVPQPFQADAWRSQSSLTGLEASLAAAKTVWEGVDNKGLRGLLPSEQKPLADKIDAAYAASLKLFASTQRSLTEMLRRCRSPATQRSLRQPQRRPPPARRRTGQGAGHPTGLQRQRR
jgi:predicted lipoprotein